MTNEIKLIDAIAKCHEATAKLNTLLEAFGDELAKRNKYRSVHGIDAVRFFLVQKHHWLPSVVSAMTFDDLRFALSEEMHGWKVPKNISTTLAQRES